MTMNENPGIRIIRSRKKMGVRLVLHRKPGFNRFITIKDLLWDNPKDHKKLEKIITEAITETEWIPFDYIAMKNLYEHLFKKYGRFKDLKNSYQYQALAVSQTTSQSKHIKAPNRDDGVLTELRLIRNYLEELTLLQKVKQ